MFSACTPPAAPSFSKNILVIGSLNADIIVEINRFPQTGETIAARSDATGFMVPGGKGANQAVAAARLGTQIGAKFACIFGNDSHATTLKDALQKSGVNIDHCASCDKPSGQAFIFLEENGSNSIIIVGGSNKAWPETVTADLEAAVKSASAVMLQREVPEHVNIDVAKIATAAGVPVVFDMGGEDTPLPDEILPHLRYVCPNETELARLTDMPTETDEQVVAAARALQAKGVTNVMATRGADGSVLFAGSEEPVWQPSFKVDKVVDTTGAGDCFRAAFTMAITEGQAPKESLAFAAAAAALCVTRLGAQPSMPERGEVQAFLEQQQA